MAEETKSESRASAISKAIEEVDKTFRTDASSDSTDDGKTKDDKKEDKKEDKADKKDETNKEDLSEEELHQSRQLYLALKDPTKANTLLEFFASHAPGYQKIETKKEAAAVKDAVLETLEENLGPEFEFLSGKLSKALDKIITAKFNEHAADIRQHIQSSNEERLSSDAAKSYKDLAQKHFEKDEIPDNISKTMSTLMDRYKPSQGTSIDDYLTDIFHMAVSKLDINLKTAKNGARIEKSRNDGVSRLHSGKGITESTTVTSKTKEDKPASIKSAIEAAKEQIEEQFSKK